MIIGETPLYGKPETEYTDLDSLRGKRIGITRGGTPDIVLKGILYDAGYSFIYGGTTINRIDEVVVFHPLGEQHIASIAQIQLKRLYKRLEERGYEIHISDEALKLLSENGYDPVYGARPLKRAIQQQIENPLAQQILSGELVPGKVIRLEVNEDRIVAVQ